MAVYRGSNAFEEFKNAILDKGVSKILCVCGSSCRKLLIFESVRQMGAELVVFDDFCPNPDISSAVLGIRVFRENKCDAILAIGGGSAMDVAKCIKLYADADLEKPLMEQPQKDTGVILAAIPTTAGTGSEATRFSVVYYNGNKMSVTHNSIIPDYVLLEPSVLDGLPEYQRKATAFDALSHAIESFWSINSTDESKSYSREAIEVILNNFEGYIRNEKDANSKMLYAANLAGRAINITQTTAGHAMSYKLTSVYGIAHGHAVALCLIPLWKFMRTHLSDKYCVDGRGSDYLTELFAELDKMIDAETFEGMVRNAELCGVTGYIKDCNGDTGNEAVEMLSNSVNTTRLKNNPVLITTENLRELYRSVFEWK